MMVRSYTMGGFEFYVDTFWCSRCVCMYKVIFEAFVLCGIQRYSLGVDGMFVCICCEGFFKSCRWRCVY